MRGKSQNCGISSCGAILITSNSALIEAAYKLCSDRFDNGEIAFAISDTELTAILWLNSFNKQSTLAETLLIENAFAACEPSPAVMDALNAQIDLLAGEGTISDDEALIMRSLRVVREAIAEESENIPSRVTPDLVFQVRQTRTIYRSIKSESKDDRLMTVYYGDFDSISDYKTISEDFYVNIQNAATSEKGFHMFLEEFLHMDLPMVRTSDGNERKLYLQLIFASMFIEQKHGWSDILSGMPVFGIRESKKRIVEFILGLDTLKNEKERDRLNAVKAKIEQKWEQLISDMAKSAHTQSCEIVNLPMHPRVLSETAKKRYFRARY